jgi:hypothetical protein
MKARSALPSHSYLFIYYYSNYQMVIEPNPLFPPISPLFDLTFF